MLTEYALTPHIFDDEHNAENPLWLDQLRAFGNRLLPIDDEQTVNTVIANLYGGSWFESNILQLIESLESRRCDSTNAQSAYNLLRQLRTRIQRHLVTRPAKNSNYPSEEEDWCQEAFKIDEETDIPIHRIVSSAKMQVSDKWFRLDQTNTDGFWDRVPDREWIEAKVEKQIDCIKKLCSFYSFIGITSPHISSLGLGRDLNFAIKVIKTAINKENGLDRVRRIDIHTEWPCRGSMSREQFSDGILEKIHDEIGEKIKIIRLYLWRSLLERHLMFGNATGGDKPNVIWTVSSTHFARPDTDGPDQDPATFTLLPRKISSKLTSRYYSPNPSRIPYEGSPYLYK